MQEYKRPPKTLRRVPRATRGTGSARARKGRTGVPPCSTFEYGGALTEMGCCWAWAIRVKRPAAWLNGTAKSLRFHEQ